MNLLALVFFVVIALALCGVRRERASIPLLIGCCYMTMGQGILLGPVNLPIFRMLLVVGILRVMVKGESFAGGRIMTDLLMFWWGLWVLFASFFHEVAPGSGPVYTLGVIFNITGVYYLFRCWIRDIDEALDLVQSIGYILAPVALEMAMEKLTGRNWFSMFGYVPEDVLVRGDSLRAQGPFGHSILAGTVGATCLPLMVGIFNRNRTGALVGGVSCLFMVIASASSGPVMSLAFGLGAVVLWRYRPAVAILRWGVLGIYVMAELLMTRPAYFLISKIDISGGSTGWHRSRLIETFISHFNEWGMKGTDYTRHWMPQGVAIGNGNHIDITNYYISFAIIGGLPSLLLIIAVLIVSFKGIGRMLAADSPFSRGDQFVIWCFGASLFGHVVTSISVSYFDQSMIFIWLSIAVIGSIQAFWYATMTGDLSEPCEDRPAGRDSEVGLEA